MGWRAGRRASNVCQGPRGVSAARFLPRTVRGVSHAFGGMVGIRLYQWCVSRNAEAGVRAVEAVPSLDISEIDTHILPSPTQPNRAGALRVGWQARHVLTLCLVDLWVGLSAATAALFL